MKALLVLVAGLSACLAEYQSYNGYKVYEVVADNDKQLNVLRTFNNGSDYDFWTPPGQNGIPGRIMVSPGAQQRFTNSLDQNQIKYSVLIENVKKTIFDERLVQMSISRAEEGSISFERFNRYKEIQAYLEYLAKKYSDIVTLETIGNTYEGRDLYMVIIGNGESDSPAILMEGGIHAREWIAPAVILYIIQQLVENPENRYLLDTNWLIIPVLNPDGYEYSHTTNRLWRKTRSRGERCYGADGNRNFDYHWMGPGTSDDECSDIFAGTHPFSEPETAAIRDVVIKYGRNIKLYISVHSCGEYILYPWSWTKELPEDDAELNSLGVDVANSIRALAGTKYTVGNSANIFYYSAGCSDDYMKAVGGIELSYTIELPGGGSNGFDIPPSRIKPVCEETWLGIVTYQNYVVKFGKKN